MSPVEYLLVLMAGYALLGVLFAVAFVMRGVWIIDPVARAARWPVRVLLAPGAAARSSMASASSAP